MYRRPSLYFRNCVTDAYLVTTESRDPPRLLTRAIGQAADCGWVLQAIGKTHDLWWATFRRARVVAEEVLVMDWAPGDGENSRVIGEFKLHEHNRFCEDCGDCLDCYGEDVCAVTGEHH